MDVFYKTSDLFFLIVQVVFFYFLKKHRPFFIMPALTAWKRTKQAFNADIFTHHFGAKKRKRGESALRMHQNGAG